jgi:diamine N-acetyltransferase
VPRPQTQGFVGYHTRSPRIFLNALRGPVPSYACKRALLVLKIVNKQRNGMNHIEIKRVGQNDIQQLQKIGRQTFSETFSAGNTQEDMETYLEEGFSLEKLTAELQHKHSEFYFASLENEVIGYLKLNFGDSQTELKDDKALEIERIYVLKEFLGKNVGQLLYLKAMQMASQADVDYVWLGVWEENHRAINFYKKNGFVAFDKHIFKLGKDEQTDLMMKLQLKNT